MVFPSTKGKPSRVNPLGTTQDLPHHAPLVVSGAVDLRGALDAGGRVGGQRSYLLQRELFDASYTGFNLACLLVVMCPCGLGLDADDEMHKGVAFARLGADDGVCGVPKIWRTQAATGRRLKH